ncbi:MAG: flagellar hook capping FlgD N-terminal domain-containing protein [Armatimonadota bacterium]
MSTSTTAVDGSSSTTTSTSSSSSSSLDKEAFLKLLTTQLQYQDPLSPMDNTEYIAQLAQFSSLEQMTNVSSNLESISDSLDSYLGSLVSNQSSYSALTLIGKKVDYTVTDSETDTTTTESGTVDSIEFKDGIPVLKINDTSVSISNVTKVSS